jgi:hypothetical protein
MRVKVTTVLGRSFWADCNDERAVMLAEDGDCVTEDGEPVAMLEYQHGLVCILDTDDGRPIVGWRKPEIPKPRTRRRRD